MCVYVGKYTLLAVNAHIVRSMNTISDVKVDQHALIMVFFLFCYKERVSHDFPHTFAYHIRNFRRSIQFIQPT